MTATEVLINVLKNLKALAETPINTDDFATKEEIKDFVTDEQIGVIFSNAMEAVFNVEK